MKKIMIVDDDELILNYYSKILKKDYDEIFTANGGTSGLKEIKEKMPNAIILDVRMPDLDGIEVLTLLKNNERTSSIPVIMNTSIEDYAEIGKCLELGAVGYIEKTNEPDEVISKIKMLLNTALNYS